MAWIQSIRNNASFIAVMISIFITAVALVVATVSLIARMGG